MKAIRLAAVCAALATLVGSWLACANSEKAQPAPTFPIGGKVSGLEGTGLALGMVGQPKLDVPAGATAFTFGNEVPDGTAYAVTVVRQPTSPSQRCVVARGTGMVRGLDVSDVLVTCSASPSRILGGRITGLASAGLVLAASGQPDLVVEPGWTAFTFDVPLPVGTAHAIRVVSQPVGQTCIVLDGGDGVVGDAELLDVLVTCFAPTGRKVQTVAAGGDGVSFVITEDGELWAWGANGGGQLGDGSRVDRIDPVRIGSSFASVVTPTGYPWEAVRTLGLKRDGTLWAWGDWSYYVPESNTVVPRVWPSPTLVGPGYVSAALGAGHALAVKADGTLWAWGRNDGSGELGTGSADWVTQLTPVHVGDGFSSVAANGDTSYAVKTDGTLWAWGENLAGEVGDGTRENRLLPVLVTSNVSSVTAVGYAMTLALKRDGTLWAWGNPFGAITEGNFPSKIAEGYASIAGPYGIRVDGTLMEWRDGPYAPPTALGDGFSLVAGGRSHSLAAKQDGTLWAWGLIRSFPSTVTAPMSPVQIGAGFGAVSASPGGVLALKTDGSAWLWSWECQGGVLRPQRVGDVGFVASVAGYFALQSDGTIWQLAGGPWGPSPTLEPMPFGAGYAHVTTNSAAYPTYSREYSHTLALKTDRTLWAWGANWAGQVRDGLGDPVVAPAQIEGHFISAAVGGSHSLAVRADGTLWEWGLNDADFLGGEVASRPPVPALVGNGFVSVAAAGAFSLAIREDGTLWAWGANGSGQLGDGTTTDRARPVRVGTGVEGFGGVAWVEASGGQTFAATRDGTLWAWGANASGLLGDGTREDRREPVRISTGFVGIATAGVYFGGDMCLHDSFAFSLAVKQDGSLWGWGSNKYGSLGLATFAARPQPVPF
jgi:alpha-tubulin suppressor-like RCC1 family protein